MDKDMMIQNETNADSSTPLRLNNIEIDTIGEILNISMGSAATAVSTLLGRKVNITTPTVSVIKSNEISLENLDPAIGIEIEYIEGLSGNNLLVMKKKDIKAIVSLLLADMDNSDDEELNELHISAVSEIMNQMMGASSTALSSFFGKSINISTPKEFDVSTKIKEISDDQSQPNVVSVRFTLDVEDLINSEFVTIMPVDFTKELVKNALNFDYLDDEPATVSVTDAGDKDNVPVIEDTLDREEKKRKEKNADSLNTERKTREEKKEHPLENRKPQAPISVKPVKLQSFDNEDMLDEDDAMDQDNFSLIMGVPLEVSVELGRTKMPVKNVLEVRQGSIIELDRQAGDPVDVIVNGQLIAKGDVVIIDDNFGIRITEILSSKEISRRIN